MPIPTLANRDNFKTYLRTFKKKFSSQIQTIEYSYIKATLSQKSSTLSDSDILKVVLFDNRETVDISVPLSNNDLLYFPALEGDVIVLEFNNNTYELEFLANGIKYGTTTYTLDQTFTIGNKYFKVKGIGGGLVEPSNAPTYAISESTTTVNEGSAVTFTVTTTDLGNGTAIPWTTESTLGLIDQHDFTDNTTQGYITVNNNSATLIRTLKNDLTLGEGIEKFKIQLRSGGLGGQIVATSSEITVSDTSFASYTLTPSATTVAEGSSVTFNLTTTNVPNGTTVYWTATGTGATADDLSILSGSTTISNNASSFAIAVKQDFVVDANQSFEVQIRTGSTSGSIVTTSPAVSITDTPFSVAIVPSTLTPSENDTVNYTVNTSGIGNGTTLYWAITHTTTDTLDFSDWQGSFTINNNTGTFSHVMRQDFTVESNTPFVITIRHTSVSGPILATSSTITVANTAFSLTITPNRTTVNESSSSTMEAVVFTIATSGVADGTKLRLVPQYVSGNQYIFADVSTHSTQPEFNALSASHGVEVTVNNNAATQTLYIGRDGDTEGTEVFNIMVRDDRLSVVIATSPNITITDTSFLGSRKTNKTFGPLAVNRDGGNATAVSDWYTLCGLDKLPNGSKIALYVDTSGSMTMATVQASHDLLIQKLNARNMDVIVVTNPSEDWITPFQQILN